MSAPRVHDYSVSEEDVSITVCVHRDHRARPRPPYPARAPRSFLNEGPGFTGILKHRFEDFHVRELAPDGELVRLTRLVREDADGDESKGGDGQVRA